MEKLPVEWLALAAPAAETERALEKMNRRLEGHGLTLRPEELRELARRRQAHLQATGRVEFGEGILPALVFTFADSPHIPPGEFAATIDALLECFYYFKNETDERVGDEELLCFMKAHFDGDCRGSAEQLYGTRLEELARGLRHGEAVEEATGPLTGWEGMDVED